MAMFADTRSLAEIRQALDAGHLHSEALTEEALARARTPEGRIVFTESFENTALAQARATDQLRKAGIPLGPLAGIPVSVKDLFDVAGRRTRAGSRVLAESPPAKMDAPVIARLRAAGAVIVGHTNMTEFAFSGLGVNPHFGTPGNPWDRNRVAGGSSSGAAVSVSDGMAFAGIGTDTGGSVRIPAAFCGLTGFKPTWGRSDLGGTIPLSTSLDSIGPIARSVACCALLDAVLAGEQPRTPQPLRGLRLAAPQTYVLDGLDEAVATAYARALSALSAAGARIDDVRFDHLAKVPDLLAGGGITAAESYAWHRRLLAEKGNLYDPRVRSRIERGAGISAADYLDILAARADQIAAMDSALAPFDAAVMPTVAIVAPKIADLESDDDYSRFNILVLRNPSVSNLLGLCCASVPCQRPGDLPVGLTVVGRGNADRHILGVAVTVEKILQDAGLGLPESGR
jgi:aspartyl-tRNA(Asn)/glutamyl-tRNA(Gln) amidotransferase subunit A